MDLNERRCGAWAVGRRGQGRTWCRDGEAEHLADKSTATGTGRKASYFLTRDVFLKVPHTQEVPV